MSTKAKNADVKILKGTEAENAVLQYVKRMNRPFGAVDITANLKGAIPKATTPKILASLAERGELVQKTYGKLSYFVADQSKIETVPPEKLVGLESECKSTDDQNQALAAEVKSVSIELGKLKSTPTDDQLDTEIASTEQAIEKMIARLEPLRSDVPLISADELNQIDADWTKWRTEWVKRKKIFTTFWQLVTDSLIPQEATELAEDLGIEFDTAEHATLERSYLCAARNTNNRSSVKRKRD